MKSTPLYLAVRFALRPFARVLFPSEINGKGNRVEQEPCILCCNHLGLSDPIRLVFAFRRQIFFMAKAELYRNKPFGWLLKKLGVFPVQRGKGDVDAINYAYKLLDENCVLGIFIEGTRSRDGELGQPKPGAVMLAYKHQVPILPVCITPVESRLPRIFRKSILSFGQPIEPQELGIVTGSGSEFRSASRLVMSKIRELREQDLLLAELPVGEM